jgi:hypothetical protein
VKRPGKRNVTLSGVLSGLRKNSNFALVLKGRGFSRAVSLVERMAASAAEGNLRAAQEFFRSLWKPHPFKSWLESEFFRSLVLCREGPV